MFLPHWLRSFQSRFTRPARRPRKARRLTSVDPLETRSLLAAEVYSLVLVNDTGTSGDNVTSDARIRGMVMRFDGSPANLPIQIDWNSDGTADATSTSDMQGQFVYDLGPSVPYGSVTVKARAGVVTSGVTTWGSWKTLTFTFVHGPSRRPRPGPAGRHRHAGRPRHLEPDARGNPRPGRHSARRRNSRDHARRRPAPPDLRRN